MRHTIKLLAILSCLITLSFSHASAFGDSLEPEPIDITELIKDSNAKDIASRLSHGNRGSGEVHAAWLILGDDDATIQLEVHLMNRHRQCVYNPLRRDRICYDMYKYPATVFLEAEIKDCVVQDVAIKSTSEAYNVAGRFVASVWNHWLQDIYTVEICERAEQGPQAFNDPFWDTLPHWSLMSDTNLTKREGTMVLQPNQLKAKGKARYSIQGDGLLSIKGEVRVAALGRIPINETHRTTRENVLSDAYTTVGATIPFEGLTLTVDSYDHETKQARASGSNQTGHFTLEFDLTGELVDLLSVTVRLKKVPTTLVLERET